MVSKAAKVVEIARSQNAEFKIEEAMAESAYVATREHNLTAAVLRSV